MSDDLDEQRFISCTFCYPHKCRCWQPVLLFSVLLVLALVAWAVQR